MKKYLLLWFVWVLVYTAYFSVLHQYSPRLIWEIFLRYFLAVRGSGIAGMWFVPAFFLVTFAYFLLAKAVAKVLPKSKIGQAALLCGISFVIYFWFDYVWAYSGGLWFSLHQVPVHLFYYSLGTLFYAVWQRPMTSACKNGLTWLGGGIAVAYCVLMLWQWDEQLWQFTQEIWFPYLTVIPITLAAVAGLFGTLMVARAIQCKFLIRLGKATLGLCLCEFFMKHVVNGVLSILEIMPTVTPLIALAFSLAFLVVGGFWVVPAMDWVIKKLLSLWEKGTRNRNTVSSQ